MRLKPVQCRAFSLIELLVVISIICLLFALLFPVLTKAREIAKNAQCTAILRQWGLALRMYAGENKGFMPVVGVWYDANGRQVTHISALAPYFGVNPPIYPTNADYVWLGGLSWRKCPCKPYFYNGPYDFKGENKIYSFWSGYGLNSRILGNGAASGGVPADPFISLNSIPANKIIAGDNIDADAPLAPGNGWVHYYVYYGAGNQANIARRHYGGGNYLYTDGRVERRLFEFMADFNRAKKEMLLP